MNSRIREVRGREIRESGRLERGGRDDRQVTKMDLAGGEVNAVDW